MSAALKAAIDRNDVAAVQALMTADPALHRAPLGYGGNGPLTWVAECRGDAPVPPRLEMAQWMIDHGSDVHQGGDGPLMRAALNERRVPMMELLVRNGADVNAEWNGHYPIIFGPCECVEPAALRWLLEHGAKPNGPGGKAQDGTAKTTPLDYLLATYSRSAELGECVALLRSAGGTTRYALPGVLETMLDRADELAALLDAEPALLHRRYAGLDCGSTGARSLTLAGATLLHVAAEYGAIACARLLLDRGAGVDAPSDAYGQTPIFHAVSQYNDWGLEVAQLLLERGAELGKRVSLPGHYDRPQERVEGTPLDYARLFPGTEFPGSNARTVALLVSRQTPNL